MCYAPQLKTVPITATNAQNRVIAIFLCVHFHSRFFFKKDFSCYKEIYSLEIIIHFC